MVRGRTGNEARTQTGTRVHAHATAICAVTSETRSGHDTPALLMVTPCPRRPSGHFPQLVIVEEDVGVKISMICPQHLVEMRREERLSNATGTHPVRAAACNSLAKAGLMC